MADDRPQEPVEQATDESVAEGLESSEVNEPLQPESTEGTEETPRKKRRLGPWLFLLLIFIGLPAAWLLAPPPLQQQALQLLESLNPQPSKPTPANLTGNEASPPAEPAPTETVPSEPGNETANEAATEATSEPQGSQPAAEHETQAEPQAAETPSTTGTEPTGTAEPAPETKPAVDRTAALQEEIHRLQNELQDMRSERATLAQRLHAQQSAGLRVRLNLLAATDTRLAQRAALWNELAALPTLDAAEQGKARKMGSLLDSDAKRLATWRQTLAKLAARIPDAEQADILPKPQNPYFASLLGGFHLRPAPSDGAQQQADLRKRLIEMQHNLGLEAWPQPSSWRQLLEALHDQFGDEAGLDLPASLSGITADIDASRTVAADWREAL